MLVAVEDLGYEPNLLARSLRSGASLSIGFVVRDISSPVLAQIALGAERTLRASGYSLVLTNSEGLPSLDAEYLRFFRRRRADGLLISVADETHAPTLKELHQLAVPFVSIDRDLPDSLRGSAVLSDHSGGIRMAAQHLAELGHRRIGLVGGPLNLRTGRECASGLTEFCKGRRRMTAIIEPGPITREHGEAAVSRMLSLRERPTAIIAASIQFLVGVLHALRGHGLQVPDDVSIVTFDEAEFLEFLDPPVAVISRNPVTMGQVAAEFLLRRLAGEGPERTVVPTTFRPRPSCAAPPRV